MKFSDKLQKLMIQSGDTQESLGNVLGVAHTTVGRWLVGVRPRPRIISKAAEHFGVPFEILLNDEKELPSPKTKAAGAVDQDGKCPLPVVQLAEKWRSLPKEERVKITDRIIECLSKNIKG